MHSKRLFELFRIQLRHSDRKKMFYFLFFVVHRKKIFLDHFVTHATQVWVVPYVIID
jgi:hypothetical protein